MKKFVVVFAVLVLAVSLCYANCGQSCDQCGSHHDSPKATEPVGAVVETGGVLIGKLTSVVENSLSGGRKESSLVLAEESGATKIIPLDATVRYLDSGFNALTLNQLQGKKVAVDVSEETGKATQVQEVK